MSWIGDAIAGLAIQAVLALVAGWALMLGVGIAHHEWIPALPTIGYWAACKLAACLFLVAGLVWATFRSPE